MTETFIAEGSTPVGVVGSNSSTQSLVVDLVGGSRSTALNGKLVLVAPEDDNGTVEYGLGTVTEITTTNIYHENPALRGVIAARGGIGNLTGRADIKTAQIEIQAAFREVKGKVLPLGGSLSFAPSTGERVYPATAEAIRSLAEQATKDLFYLGSVYRQRDIPLPLSAHDFSGARGSEMCGFFGPSGSGKTYVATEYVGSQFRHRDMAFLLVDPQGQFTTNSKVARDLPIDLRALADAQGREVRQLSVAREVRLPEDAGLFTNLLASSGFFGASRMIGANNKASDAQDVVEAWLESTPNWSSKDPETLLEMMLGHLIERVEADAVVVSKAPKERMIKNLTSALHGDDDDGEGRRAALLRVWMPFLNMFSETGPSGEKRSKMNEIVRELCESDIGSAGKRKYRPFYILTLADVGGSEQMEVTKALRHTKTQMVILDTLFTSLENEARRLYQSDDLDPANLMVILDEAARFTSDNNRHPEQRAMAEKMGRFFRELRKYAVGFTLILQEPSALLDSIWKQLQNGFRMFASGMVGNDLDKVREQVGSPGAMKLYQQLARPSKDNPIYPWMLCGSISPLSVTSAPLFMEAYTSPQEWATANHSWLPRIFQVDDLWNGR